MWEFYLAACEGAFRYGASNVFQMQLARERDDAPLTRDYIAAEEARLKASEAEWLERVLASTDTEARKKIPG
jgi:cyclopropane-fatty-acyl-phospholipid synthase